MHQKRITEFLPPILPDHVKLTYVDIERHKHKKDIFIGTVNEATGEPGRYQLPPSYLSLFEMLWKDRIRVHLEHAHRRLDDVRNSLFEAENTAIL